MVQTIAQILNIYEIGRKIGEYVSSQAAYVKANFFMSVVHSPKFVKVANEIPISQSPSRLLINRNV